MVWFKQYWEHGKNIGSIWFFIQNLVQSSADIVYGLAL